MRKKLRAAVRRRHAWMYHNGSCRRTAHCNQEIICYNNLTMTHPTAIDITNMPTLRHVVEELRTTKQPRLLKQDSKPVALLLPLGYTDQPEDIWKDYNAKQV